MMPSYAVKGQLLSAHRPRRERPEVVSHELTSQPTNSPSDVTRYAPCIAPRTTSRPAVNRRIVEPSNRLSVARLTLALLFADEAGVSLERTVDMELSSRHDIQKLLRSLKINFQAE